MALCLCNRDLMNRMAIHIKTTLYFHVWSGTRSNWTMVCDVVVWVIHVVPCIPSWAAQSTAHKGIAKYSTNNWRLVPTSRVEINGDLIRFSFLCNVLDIYWTFYRLNSSSKTICSASEMQQFALLNDKIKVTENMHHEYNLLMTDKTLLTNSHRAKTNYYIFNS